MHKLIRRLGTLPSIVILVVTLWACGPPQTIPPVPPTPMCQEEAGDQTPEVFEVAWLYPNEPNIPQPGCVPEKADTQVDVWIQMVAGQNVVEQLCASLFGLLKGPIDPAATWGVCMDVRRSVLGMPT